MRIISSGSDIEAQENVVGSVMLMYDFFELAQ